MTTKAKKQSAMKVAYSYDPDFLGARLETVRESAQNPEDAHQMARSGAWVLGYNEYWILEFFGKQCLGGARYTCFMGEWQRRQLYVEEASA